MFLFVLFCFGDAFTFIFLELFVVYENTSTCVCDGVRVVYPFSFLCCVFVLFAFLLFFVYPMLPVYLDCRFFSLTFISIVMVINSTNIKKTNNHSHLNWTQWQRHMLFCFVLFCFDVALTIVWFFVGVFFDAVLAIVCFVCCFVSMLLLP
jgi:hypothetical protein